MGELDLSTAESSARAAVAQASRANHGGGADHRECAGARVRPGQLEGVLRVPPGQAAVIPLPRPGLPAGSRRSASRPLAAVVTQSGAMRSRRASTPGRTPGSSAIADGSSGSAARATPHAWTVRGIGADAGDLAPSRRQFQDVDRVPYGQRRDGRGHDNQGICPGERRQLMR